MLGTLQPEFFPHVFGPGQDEPLDADAVRAKFAALAAEIREATGDERTPDRGRRRLPQDRGREHGQRDQEDLGAARLRRDRLHAQLLRRRGRAARLPGGRRARHDDRADPSLRRRALGLRHGPRRHPRAQGEGGRGAAGRRADAGACGGARRSRRPGRGGAARAGHPRRAHRGAPPRAHPLRGERHAARHRVRNAAGDAGPLRGRASPALRLHHAAEEADRGGGGGRGHRRDGGDAGAGPRRQGTGRRAAAARDGAGPHGRARARDAGVRPGRHAARQPRHRACDRPRADGDDGGGARLAGGADGEGAPGARPCRAPGAHLRGGHRVRPGDAGGVQQPVHVHRRADGRDAGEHRLFGEHQGAAGFLLRDVRSRRQSGRQCAAHPDPPGLDGPIGAHGAGGEPRRPEAGRRLRGECALQRRHPPAGRDRHHADLRRGGRGDPVLRGEPRPPRRYRRAHAGLDAAGQPDRGGGGHPLRQLQAGGCRRVPGGQAARASGRRPLPPRASPTTTSPISRRRSPPATGASARSTA